MLTSIWKNHLDRSGTHPDVLNNGTRTNATTTGETVEKYFLTGVFAAVFALHDSLECTSVYKLNSGEYPACVALKAALEAALCSVLETELNMGEGSCAELLDLGRIGLGGRRKLLVGELLLLEERLYGSRTRGLFFSGGTPSSISERKLALEEHSLTFSYKILMPSPSTAEEMKTLFNEKKDAIASSLKDKIFEEVEKHDLLRGKVVVKDIQIAEMEEIETEEVACPPSQTIEECEEAQSIPKDWLALAAGESSGAIMKNSYLALISPLVIGSLMLM